jgi:hypothetical protein
VSCLKEGGGFRGVLALSFSHTACSPEVTHTPPVIFFCSEVSSLARYAALLLSALFSPCFSFHTSVPTFCRERAMDCSMAPDRTSYYVLERAYVGTRRWREGSASPRPFLSAPRNTHTRTRTPNANAQRPICRRPKNARYADIPGARCWPLAVVGCWPLAVGHLSADGRSAVSASG